MTGDPKKFLDDLASPVVEELRAIEGIKKFTTNSDVIGAHAECSVRRLVSRFVRPLRVCTGAVISEQLCANPRSVPQLDTIIWQPLPAPAVFEVGDFGLVPRGSAMAIMSIKRSAYRGVGADLKKDLNPTLVRKLVADDPLGWVGTDQPELYPDFPAMGVVCVREKTAKDEELEALVAKGHAVVLLELGEPTRVNSEAVWRLINFLMRARARARGWEGYVFANVGLVKK